ANAVKLVKINQVKSQNKIFKNMPKLNPYLENKKPIELVQEIKDEYKVPSYEEFVKSYENDEEINESYDFEVASYGGIGEPKGSGPMFNFFQLLQVLVNTPAGPVVETVGRAASSPDISRAVVETGRFIEEHSNEISQIGRSFAVGNSSSSYSAFTAASSYRLTHYRDGIKTNGKSGPKRCYYTWDGFHNEIEMYDHLGNPVDAIDPITGNRLFNP
ncbi:20801_t:CDS:2, partial [Racocetra persica]